MMSEPSEGVGDEAVEGFAVEDMVGVVCRGGGNKVTIVLEGMLEEEKGWMRAGVRVGGGGCSVRGGGVGFVRVAGWCCDVYCSSAGEAVSPCIGMAKGKVRARACVGAGGACVCKLMRVEEKECLVICVEDFDRGFPGGFFVGT